MRHNKSGRKFSVCPDVRKAMLRNVTDALVVKGRIKTTVAKAKEVRRIADKLITLAKQNTLASRREALRWLRTRDAFKRLFGEYAESFKDRNGGYTRVTKAGFRAGDNAHMAYIEYIIEAKEDDKKKTAPTKRRRRRAPSKEKAQAAAE